MGLGLYLFSVDLDRNGAGILWTAMDQCKNSAKEIQASTSIYE